MKSVRALFTHSSPLFTFCCSGLVPFLNRTFVSFAPHALKGQKLLAQGIALGNYGRNPVAL
ncbi:hypothetical protein [Segatella sp.]|uniref:hypothetical protein n=1 Tax=Segatella sp. TaxID=2974253 RepID=UPI003A9134D3